MAIPFLDHLDQRVAFPARHRCRLEQKVFPILTKSGITDVFPSAINGSVGASPIPGLLSI